MNADQASQVDLAKLFNAVTRTLKENQQSLNSADEYNHNHGDNMLENFQVITKAVRKKKNSLPAEQLAYASEVLNQRSQSGSAQLYSQGLARAADQMKGQSIITPENAMLLVQALMGGQTTATSQPAASSQGGGGDMADLLGGLLTGQSSAQPEQGTGTDLLSSLMGGQPQSSQAAEGDLLGGLLGAFLGNTPVTQAAQQPTSQTAQASGGIDLNTLISAGLAFFQARQQGAAPVTALVQALMVGSQMQASTHHSQSGQLVAGTLLNTIGSMLSSSK